MAKVERALIVGAGIGGLAAYTSLAQAGIEADVIERTPDVDVYGVGICQPANSLRILKRMGLLEEIVDVGWAFEDWLFFDHHENLVVEVPSLLGRGEDGVPAEVGLMRPELHRVLIEATLREAGGNISRAAQSLGLSRQALYRRMERFNLRQGGNG